VGDGTTSVIILAGELMSVAEPFLVSNVHPINIVRAYFKALEVAGDSLAEISKEIDYQDKE